MCHDIEIFFKLLIYLSWRVRSVNLGLAFLRRFGDLFVCQRPKEFYTSYLLGQILVCAYNIASMAKLSLDQFSVDHHSCPVITTFVYTSSVRFFISFFSLQNFFISSINMRWFCLSSHFVNLESPEHFVNL